MLSEAAPTAETHRERKSEVEKVTPWRFNQEIGFGSVAVRCVAMRSCVPVKRRDFDGWCFKNCWDPMMMTMGMSAVERDAGSEPPLSFYKGRDAPDPASRSGARSCVPFRRQILCPVPPTRSCVPCRRVSFHFQSSLSVVDWFYVVILKWEDPDLAQSELRRANPHGKYQGRWNFRL